MRGSTRAARLGEADRIAFFPGSVDDHGLDVVHRERAGGGGEQGRGGLLVRLPLAGAGIEDGERAERAGELRGALGIRLRDLHAGVRERTIGKAEPADDVEIALEARSAPAAGWNAVRREEPVPLLRLMPFVTDAHRRLREEPQRSAAEVA